LYSAACFCWKSFTASERLEKVEPPWPTLRASAASVALLVGPVRWVELLELGPEFVVEPLLLLENRDELPQVEPPLVDVRGEEPPLDEPHVDPEEEPDDDRPLPNELPPLLLLRLLLLEEELRPPLKLPPLLPAPRAQSSSGKTTSRATNRQARRNIDFIGDRREWLGTAGITRR
jgi:hypothetical protein